MKIAVASNNPLKVNSVKKVFAKFFNDLELFHSEVNSNVSSQPLNDEAVKGALNRVYRIKEIFPDCDYYVAIESGVMNYSDRGLSFSAIVIMNNKLEKHYGFSPAFELPPEITDKIFQGNELGPLIDSLTNEKDTKKKYGAVGILSNEVTNREELTYYGILMALIPFVNKYYH